MGISFTGRKKKNILGPATRFPAFTSPDPRLSDPKLFSGPVCLKREFNSQVKREQSEEMDRMRDDGVDVVWGLTWIATI